MSLSKKLRDLEHSITETLNMHPPNVLDDCGSGQLWEDSGIDAAFVNSAPGVQPYIRPRGARSHYGRWVVVDRKAFLLGAMARAMQHEGQGSSRKLWLLFGSPPRS